VESTSFFQVYRAVHADCRKLDDRRKEKRSVLTTLEYACARAWRPIQEPVIGRRPEPLSTAESQPYRQLNSWVAAHLLALTSPPLRAVVLEVTPARRTYNFMKHEHDFMLRSPWTYFSNFYATYRISKLCCLSTASRNTVQVGARSHMQFLNFLYAGDSPRCTILPRSGN